MPSVAAATGSLLLGGIPALLPAEWMTLAAMALLSLMIHALFEQRCTVLPQYPLRCGLSRKFGLTYKCGYLGQYTCTKPAFSKNKTVKYQCFQKQQKNTIYTKQICISLNSIYNFPWIEKLLEEKHKLAFIGVETGH